MTNESPHKFWKPIKVRDGRLLTNIDQAREFLLSDPNRHFRRGWQSASDALGNAAAGGSIDLARIAMKNALFQNTMLDLEENFPPRKSPSPGRERLS